MASTNTFFCIKKHSYEKSMYRATCKYELTLCDPFCTIWISPKIMAEEPGRMKTVNTNMTLKSGL